MAMWSEEVLLEGDFTMPSKRRTAYKVTLIHRVLFYSQISQTSTQYEEKSVQMSDVVGCHCSETRLSPLKSAASSVVSLVPSDINGATFTVYSYPFRKKVFSGKRTRHRHVITFEINLHNTFEENQAIAQKWRTAICCLARGFEVTLDGMERCKPPPWNQFLILINPHSGPGRALQIFKNDVEPMLCEAGIPFKLIVTEYAGHAVDLVKTLKLSEWGGVVVVSGDGLIFETINGLMQREDWTSAIKTPVGCVPGGSGNALACAINYAAGEPTDVDAALHSTFVLIKHHVVPMDLVLVQTPTQHYFSFLSVTWGIVADIDYESERYRNLGEARFTLGAIKRIVNLRAYQGRLSFLPVAEYIPKTTSKPKILKKIRRLSLRSCSSRQTLNSQGSEEGINPRLTPSPNFSQNVRSRSNTPNLDEKLRTLSMPVNFGSGDFTDSRHVLSSVENSSYQNGLDVPAEGSYAPSSSGSKTAKDVSRDAKLSMGMADAATLQVTCHSDLKKNLSTNASQAMFISEQISQAGDSEKQLINGTTAANGRFNNSDTASSVSAKNGSDFEEETVYAAKKDGQAVPTPLLPPLDKPVPENWMVIEGKFILVCAVYQTHLGSDMLAAPSARMADGIIHLMFVREGVSRNNLLNLFLSFGEGGHVDSPCVEFVPVLAFRLEPDENRGNIMVDGERLDPVPMQAQILPGLARIMAIK